MKRRPRYTEEARWRHLARFERSGLSGVAYARREGLGYSTLCAWKARAGRERVPRGFQRVEVSGGGWLGSVVVAEVVLDNGVSVRVMRGCGEELGAILEAARCGA
jgi:hypothetical protein